MKKVYLVKVYYQTGSWSQAINLQVFTNRKLAKTYLKYKKLKKKQNPEVDVDIVRYELEEFEISKLDCSEELTELQKKELHY